MSDAIDARPFPRGILLAAAALLGASLLAAAASRHTGIGAAHVVTAPLAETRVIRFERRLDGSMLAIEDATNSKIADIPAGKHGFIDVVLQRFEGDRRYAASPSGGTYHLHQYSDGRAAIEDPLTGGRIMVDAFGPDNFSVFAQLFSQKRNAR